MIRILAEKISIYLIKKGVIELKEKELYEYSLIQLQRSLINITTCILLGFVLDATIQVIVITLIFMCVRVYAGGFHASSPGKCYILSFLISFVGIIIVKYIYINNIVLCALFAFSYIIILAFAPVDTNNKRLSEAQKMVIRKKCIFVSGSICIIGIFSFVMRMKMLFAENTIAISEVAMGMILQMYKNKLNGGKL